MSKMEIGKLRGAPVIALHDDLRLALAVAIESSYKNFTSYALRLDIL